MAKYKVKHTSILHNGKLYKEGSAIELTETQAKRLEDFVTLIPNQTPTKPKTETQATKPATKPKSQTKTKTDDPSKDEDADGKGSEQDGGVDNDK